MGTFLVIVVEEGMETNERVEELGHVRKGRGRGRRRRLETVVCRVINEEPV